MGRTVCRLLHFRSKRNPANDFQIIKTFTSHGRQSKAKKAGNQLTFSSSLSLSLTKELLMQCAKHTVIHVLRESGIRASGVDILCTSSAKSSPSPL